MAMTNQEMATHLQEHTITYRIGEFDSLLSQIYIYCDENGVSEKEAYLLLKNYFNLTAKEFGSSDDDGFYDTMSCGLASISPTVSGMPYFGLIDDSLISLRSEFGEFIAEQQHNLIYGCECI